MEVILEEQQLAGGQAAESRPYTTLSLILGKDITLLDSKGNTNFWDSPSGKLWEQCFGRRMNFVDFWSVTLQVRAIRSRSNALLANSQADIPSAAPSHRTAPRRHSSMRFHLSNVG